LGILAARDVKIPNKFFDCMTSYAFSKYRHF
jgi:hypothetical protein